MRIAPEQFFTPSNVDNHWFSYVETVRSFVEQDLHRSIEDIERMDYASKSTGRWSVQLIFSILFRDEIEATKTIDVAVVWRKRQV